MAIHFEPDQSEDPLAVQLAAVPDWVEKNRRIGDLIRAAGEFTSDYREPPYAAECRRLDPNAAILWNNRIGRFQVVVYEEHLLRAGPVEDLDDGLIAMPVRVPVPVFTFQRAEDNGFLWPTRQWENAVRFALVRYKGKWIAEQKRRDKAKKDAQDKRGDDGVARIESRLIPAWQRDREERRPAYSGLAVTTGTGPTHSSRFFGEPFVRVEAQPASTRRA